MIVRRKLFLLLCLIAFCAIPICSSASLPLVGFPLKPSPAEGPYQDKVFLEKTNVSIYSLSNQTVPTGTALRDLQSLQQQISKMKISPELYEEASDINSFLYYTTKAGDEYDDAISLTGTDYSPVSQNGALFNDANEYYFAAKKVWERIKSRYPNATLYTMTAGSDSDSSSDDLYAYDKVSTQGHSGLW